MYRMNPIIRQAFDWFVMLRKATELGERKFWIQTSYIPIEIDRDLNSAHSGNFGLIQIIRDLISVIV